MTIWINEFHYDNSGTDAGEFLEIAGPAGTDLTGWTVVLYNGANQLSYDTVPLTGTIDDEGDGFGAASFSGGFNLQNGGPDGFALVRPDGTVEQFLSYEGSFTALNGPASGLTSADIGEREGSSTPVGFSLQLTGTGSSYSDFTWAAPASETPGSLNSGQLIDAVETSDTMLAGQNGWDTEAIWTVGESIDSGNAYNDLNGDSYTPVGVLDGLGAYELDDGTVRVFANHELLQFRGSEYFVSDGQGGSFSMIGARVSYFDIDKDTMQVVDSGLAYNTIVDANGDVASDTSFLLEGFGGFSRFCSSVLIEAEQFGEGRGLEDRIYFTGEEDGGFFNPVGGAEWALDPETGTIYQLPAFGRGAWENVTEIDSGSDDQVAFILSDDSSPFDFDPENDNGDEAAPLFLYVGSKNPDGDFLERNGLNDGKLYVWVSDEGDLTPLDYRGTGAERSGMWVEIDNARYLAEASEDGSTGYDEYGYPTQGNLWLQARDLGAFGFSRPEDVAVNPVDGTEFALASTGVDTYAVDPDSGDGADTFGTVYTMQVDVQNLTGAIRIAYDGDDDPARSLRSPDNLDWADDGYLYIQEDKAEDDSLTGEPLFGDGAANTNEASIVRLDPETGETFVVATIDRDAVLDPTTAGTPVDFDAGTAGEWESSGIVDVSTLFGEVPGTLFLATVQAHGIADQEDVNADSRISDDDLVEGGQLLFLKAPEGEEVPPAPEAAEVLLSRTLGQIDLGGDAQAEIVAYSPEFQRAFVTSDSGLRVVDVSDPTNPNVIATLAEGTAINSVAVSKNMIAIAVAADDRTDNGEVQFFHLGNLGYRGAVEVGPNPDDLKWDAQGKSLIVVNEGESSGGDNQPAIDEYGEPTINPEGSVSIVNVNRGHADKSEVLTLDFSDPSITFDALEALGLRMNRDAPSAAADLEPEYVTLDGNTAYVSLQENNGILVIDDITDPQAITIDNFFSLGTKDYSVVGAGLDASNRDDGINIQNYNIEGLYMADQIATIEVDGKTYVLTANEGDGRGDTDEGGDESRGADLVDGDLSNGEIDRSAFDTTTIIQLGLDDQLGRLKFSTHDKDGDGYIDELQAFGGRSFSIYDAETGEQVYDSGDDFEQITAALVPELFNADDGDPGEFDDRSDDKGPEPESITTGVIDGEIYAFIGLERTGGVMVYNVSDPTAPVFERYITVDGDISPEGLQFVSPEDSPTGQPMLMIANEVSGTLSLVEVRTRDIAIYDIQGEGHVANYLGETVQTGGIVTAVDSNGFYLQDPEGDGNIATSDALFVFTGSSPTVAVGDEITLQGRIGEFTPGGTSTRNLSTTQLSSISDLVVVSSGNDLPEATIIGASGRVPPSENIDDDAFGDFDPVNDGIDFFESLEGMLVTAEDVVAVSGTNRFGEIFAVANQGDDATGISERGTLNISEDDFNPEKIQIDEDSGVFNFDFPEVDTGAHLGDVTGVVGYGFGNFEIIPTTDFTGQIVDSTLAPETLDFEVSDGALLFASYNVLNLDPNDSDGDEDIADGRFASIAEDIAVSMGLPYIVALQEIQDNSGSANDGTTAADQTLQLLADEIYDISGVDYSFVDNDFIGNNVSGGQPGANIRTAFLYDDSVLDLIDGSVMTIGGQGEGDAFFDARLPLVASFDYMGEEITFVNVHFSSKGGSAPILGVEQDFVARQEEPDVNGSLDERQRQADAVAEYVMGRLEADSDANIVVLGDFNEFEFISPLQTLEGAGLTNLWDDMPDDEIYSYNFQGNSQALDHILVSDNLLAGVQFDAVHVNSEFAETDSRSSDHDPLVASVLGADDLIFA